MNTEARQYKDVAGNPVTLDWLTRNEPGWAANQIRHRDTLQADLDKQISVTISQMQTIRQMRELETAVLEAVPLLKHYENQLASSLSCDSRSHDGDRECRRQLNAILEAAAKLKPSAESANDQAHARRDEP